jgi:hypothetical protein
MKETEAVLETIHGVVGARLKSPPAPLLQRGGTAPHPPAPLLRRGEP